MVLKNKIVIGFIIIFGIVAIVCGSILLETGGFLRDDYDSFGNLKLKVSTNKINYQIGDTVELIFSIDSSSPHKVRLFKEKYKSLFLQVTVNSKGRLGHHEYEPPVKNKNRNFSWFVKDDKTITGDEIIEEIYIQKDNPYKLVVRGVILKDKKTGHLVFDFADFGQFEILKRADRYGIYGFWRPIDPHRLDSLEDTTNVVEFSVKE